MSFILFSGVKIT